MSVTGARRPCHPADVEATAGASYNAARRASEPTTMR